MNYARALTLAASYALTVVSATLVLTTRPELIL